MKNNTRNLYIVIIMLLLISGNIVLIYKHVETKKKLIQYYSQYSNDYFYEYRRKIQSIEIENEYLEFSPEIHIGKDTLTSISLANKIKKSTLICYFPMSSCPPCINLLLEKIKNAFPDYAQRDDIIFFSNDVEYKLRNNFYGKQIFQYADKKQVLPAEKYSTPYLFILDKEMKTKLFFFMDKQTPDYTDDYLNIVKQKIFNHETKL